MARQYKREVTKRAELNGRLIRHQPGKPGREFPAV